MSCVGTVMGPPCAGERILLEASISVAASIWASGRERNVDGHLVAIEIRIERRADQRVNLEGFTFHQHWLESLNAEAVQRGRAVQQNRVILDHLFEDVPNHGILLLHSSFACLIVVQWPRCSRR